MDPARFVFLDETGTATNMTRRYGRCPSDPAAGGRRAARPCVDAPSAARRIFRQG
jgi:hypothetical protein